MNIRILIVIALLFSSSTTYAEEFNWNDPNAILSEIKNKGSIHVVRTLWKNWAQWDEVMKNIASGEKAWIEVAEQLHQGSDAGSSESLKIALALALPNSPENVLPLIDYRFDIEWICGFPFIEPKREFLLNHYKKTKHALEQPLSNDLKEIQTECLQTLNSQKEHIFSRKK